MSLLLSVQSDILQMETGVDGIVRNWQGYKGGKCAIAQYTSVVRPCPHCQKPHGRDAP